MSLHAPTIRLIAALLLPAVLAACNTTPTPTGSASGPTDPLPNVQLGQDSELDEDVGAIAVADNEALECTGSQAVFTQQSVLTDLKFGYTNTPGVSGAFKEFVAGLLPIVESRRDQICDLQLGDDEDLDEAIARITESANELAVCTGGAEDADDEGALLAIKTLFFSEGIDQPDLIEFAQQEAGSAEQNAADTCAESESPDESTRVWP